MLVIMDDTLPKDITKVLNKTLEPGITSKEVDAFKDFFKMLTSAVNLSHNMHNYALWLVKAMKCYHAKDVTLPLLLDFMFDLATFTSKDEASFGVLKNDRFFVDLMDTVQATKEPYQKRKLQYIKLIDALATHKQGLDWIMNNSAWVDVAVLASHEDYIIAQEGSYTTARILEAAAISHQTLCLNIVELITFPLTNKVANYQAQCEGLQPGIRCIVEVLERLVEGFSSQALDVFVKMKITQLCDALSSQSKNRNLRLQLSRIVLMLSFYELTQTLEGINIVKQDLTEMVGMTKMMLRESEFGSYFGITEICFYTLKYYIKMEGKLPKYFYNGKILDLKHELLFYQCCFIASSTCKMVNIADVAKDYYDDLARLEFWSHLCNHSSRESLMLLYSLEDLVMKTPFFDSELLALKSIVETKAFYCQSMIRTIFRMFFSTLEDILLYRKKVKCLPSYNIEKEQEFVSALLDAISDFVESFKLSYSDCLGLSDIIELAVGWLNCSESWQLTVNGLRLIKISITKNMSSNLVLLRDSIHSSLTNVESLLYSKCGDRSWQVRNASLDVFYSVANKPNHDLLTMKKTLASENFSKSLLKIAFEDEHCLVRATAFRLIGSVIKFKENENFVHDEFIDKILKTLRMTQDKNLRKEIVNLLTQICNRCSHIDSRTYKIYECILNLPQPNSCEGIWLSILRFWKNAINKHLSDEGIEDGKFPAAIFSKEKKKIIILTSDEIKKRLVNTFNNLSYSGCLTQIYQTLVDENAPDVVFELACKIATNLSNILELYGVTFKTWSEETESYEDLLTISVCSEKSAVALREVDQIIDDIIFEMSFQEEGCSSESKLEELQPPFICDRVSPKEFLDMIQQKQSLTKELRLLQRFQTLVNKILD